MWRTASPIAWEPAAHADATPKLGPCGPSSIPTIPAAVFPRIAGTMNGDTFLPLSRASACFSNVSIPPKAEPMMQPNRHESVFSRSIALSATAILLAAIARCVYRSVDLTLFLLSNHGAGSKSLHSAPIVVGKRDASNPVTSSIPHSPAVIFSQNSSPLPSADTTPSPVTTIFGAPSAAIRDTGVRRADDGAPALGSVYDGLRERTESIGTERRRRSLGQRNRRCSAGRSAPGVGDSFTPRPSHRKFAMSELPTPPPGWPPFTASQVNFARAATPPSERGNFDDDEFVDLRSVDPSIPVSGDAACLLQLPVARGLSRAQAALLPSGETLEVRQCYAPWWHARLLRDAAPADQRDLLPDADAAATCALHRGCAVDVVLCSSGGGAAGALHSRLLRGETPGGSLVPLPMPTAYGELRAPVPAAAGADDACARLAAAMAAAGFSPGHAWWRFEHLTTALRHPIQNVSAGELSGGASTKPELPLPRGRSSFSLGRKRSSDGKSDRERKLASPASQGKNRKSSEEVTTWWSSIWGAAPPAADDELPSVRTGALGANWKEGDVALLPLPTRPRRPSEAPLTRAQHLLGCGRDCGRAFAFHFQVCASAARRCLCCCAQNRPPTRRESQQREVEDAVFSGKLSGALPTPVLTPSPSSVGAEMSGKI